MFKNMKKKLMVIISAILVFTMIPSVAFADAAATTYESVSDYFASLSEGNHDLTNSVLFYYKDETEGNKTNSMVAKYVRTSLEVDSQGKYNLTVNLVSKGYTFSDMNLVGKASTNEGITGTDSTDGTERNVFTYVFKDISPEAFEKVVESDHAGDFTHKLVFDNFVATNTSKNTLFMF